MSEKIKKKTPSGVNFLGLSFQAGVLIFLSVYGGIKLDQKVGVTPLFIILFSLLAVVFSMYYIITKTTPKRNKNG